MNKKEEVINAARDLFTKYGYKKVSMDEIAKEANVTKKTIYSIIGVVLLLISVYTFGVEKQNAKKKAERKAELKALRAEQKRLNKGKKKKKKKKIRK